MFTAQLEKELEIRGKARRRAGPAVTPTLKRNAVAQNSDDFTILPLQLTHYTAS